MPASHFGPLAARSILIEEMSDPSHMLTGRAAKVRQTMASRFIRKIKRLYRCQVLRVSLVTNGKGKSCAGRHDKLWLRQMSARATGAAL